MMVGGEEEVEQKPQLLAKVEKEYKKIREHAETYPYVWGSYILVYGGLGIYTALRWRKLRKTETIVRTLQERLSKIHEAEEAASAIVKSTTNGSAGASAEKFIDKLPK